MIFINYRRDDSSGVTGRIYDHLRGAFGREQIYRDVNDIPLGEDFVEHIGLAVGKASVVLVVIGAEWHSERLADPNDFVRLEIEAALSRRIPVIPVLVDGGELPATETLPESLRKLVRRHAITVDSGADFETHVGRLIQGVRAILERGDPGRPSATSLSAVGRSLPAGSVVRRRTTLVVAVVAVLALALVVLLVRSATETEEAPAAQPPAAPSVVQTSPTPSAAAVAPGAPSATTPGAADALRTAPPALATSPSKSGEAPKLTMPAIPESTRISSGELSKNPKLVPTSLSNRIGSTSLPVSIPQRVHFAEGSAETQESSAPLLDDIAAIVKNNPEIKVRVEGHRSKDEAASLDQKRAEAVRLALVGRGVSADRLSSASFGAAKPLVNDSTPEGRVKNRRVSFAVVK